MGLLTARAKSLLPRRDDTFISFALRSEYRDMFTVLASRGAVDVLSGHELSASLEAALVRSDTSLLRSILSYSHQQRHCLAYMLRSKLRDQEHPIIYHILKDPALFEVFAMWISQLGLPLESLRGAGGSSLLHFAAIDPIPDSVLL